MQWWNCCKRSTCVLNQFIRPSCWTRCLGRSRVLLAQRANSSVVCSRRPENVPLNKRCFRHGYATSQCKRWYYWVSAYWRAVQASISSDCWSVERSRERRPVVRWELAYKPKGLIILRHKCIPSCTLSAKPICHSVVGSSCIVTCKKGKSCSH